MTDESNTAGKGGFGGVFGSKKLKAIVVRGTGEVTMAHPQELLDLAYDTQRYMTRKEYEPESSHAYRGSLFGPMTVVGSDLWKEGQEGTKTRVGYCGCMMCPIACGMSVKFLDGYSEGTGHIMCVETTPETEEMAVNNENYGRAAFARLKEMDKYGYSVWSMHLDIWPLFTYGILKPEDLGIDAVVGSVEFSRELIRKISTRDGVIANELANGRAHFLLEFLPAIAPEAAEVGKLMYEMQCVVTGQSRLTYNYGANFYGPIGWIGSCVSRGRDNDLTWAFANTITDPRVCVSDSEEYNALQQRIGQMLWGTSQGAIDNATFTMSEYIPPMCITAHNYKAWVDATGLCANLQPHISMYTEDYLGDWTLRRKMYNAVVGTHIDTDQDEYDWCSRIWMQERAIICREGQGIDDDWMYDCVFEDDSYKMFGMTREGLRAGIDQYYDLRGLSKKTGYPLRSELERLDLKDVADELEQKWGLDLSE